MAAFVGDSAGLLAAAMMAILRNHPELHGDPGNALTAANRMFHLVTGPDQFLTGVYVPKTGGLV